jgi:hypothetical protein
MLIWRLFSTDEALNQLFSDIETLSMEEILGKIEELSKRVERAHRSDGFGQMINGYADSIAYLNNLLNFFRGKSVQIDRSVLTGIRKAFANTDFSAGFDTLDAIRKIEACIERYSEDKIPRSGQKKPEFYKKSWAGVRGYLNNAIMAMNGPSMYQIMRSGDRQVYLDKPVIKQNADPEPSLLFGSEREKELIDSWRKFRAVGCINKKVLRDYQFLVENTVHLWLECNEVAKQRDWKKIGFIFKPTNKVIGIPLTLNNAVVRNRNDFAQYINAIYIWIVEASANNDRLPNNQEVLHYAVVFKELRNHFDHDREHGKLAEVRKKHMIVGSYFDELIGKQPLKEVDWWLMQLAILLRVSALLYLVLEILTSNNKEE